MSTRDIQLTLIMGVEAARIKLQRLVRSHVSSRIGEPQIPVHQRRLHGTSVTLQWPQQPGNDLSKYQRQQDIECRVMPLGGYLKISGELALEAFEKDDSQLGSHSVFSGRFPLYVPRGHVVHEFSGW